LNLFADDPELCGKLNSNGRHGCHHGTSLELKSRQVNNLLPVATKNPRFFEFLPQPQSNFQLHEIPWKIGNEVERRTVPLFDLLPNNVFLHFDGRLSGRLARPTPWLTS